MKLIDIRNFSNKIYFTPNDRETPIAAKFVSKLDNSHFFASLASPTYLVDAQTNEVTITISGALFEAGVMYDFYFSSNSTDLDPEDKVLYHTLIFVYDSNLGTPQEQLNASQYVTNDSPSQTNTDYVTLD